jgi:hypothetical protein
MIEPSSSEEDEEEVPDAPSGPKNNGKNLNLANGKGILFCNN